MKFSSVRNAGLTTYQVDLAKNLHHCCSLIYHAKNVRGINNPLGAEVTRLRSHRTSKRHFVLIKPQCNRISMRQTDTTRCADQTRGKNRSQTQHTDTFIITLIPIIVAQIQLFINLHRE